MSAFRKPAFVKRVMLVLAVLALSSLACSLSDLGPTETPAPQETHEAQPVTEQPATEAPATEAPATEAPTEAVTQPPAQSAGRTGFVALKGGMFQAYDLSGAAIGKALNALNQEWLNEADLSFYPDAIYFSVFDANNRGVFRGTPDGAQKVSFIQTDQSTSVAVSKEFNRIAWSQDIYTTSAGGELWIAELDGSNAQRVVYLDPATNPNYTVLRVHRWLPDGTLLYSKEPTGIGGYILYSGWSSLYRYNPQNGQIQAIVEYGNSFICLDEFNTDYSRYVSSCDRKISIHDLTTNTAVELPAVDEQGQVGSAHFSPSGKLVAYAVARGNPEDESGKLVVAAADGSNGPFIIATRAGVIYHVEGWVDEDTLLVSWASLTESGSTLATIRRDGSNLTEIVQGARFIGWLP